MRRDIKREIGDRSEDPISGLWKMVPDFGPAVEFASERHSLIRNLSRGR